MLDFLSGFYLDIVRWILPVLCILIIFFLRISLVPKRQRPRLLAILDIKGFARIPIEQYETTIGRSRTCDIVLPLYVISRQHAVLTMKDIGVFTISDTGSQAGVKVNGEVKKSGATVVFGDEISLAGVEMKLIYPTKADAEALKKEKKYRKYKKDEKRFIPLTMLLINLVQLLGLAELLLVTESKYIPLFSGIMLFMAALMWIYKLVSPKFGVENPSAEITAFFMTSIGFLIVGGAAPESLLKLFITFIMGFTIFIVLTCIMRNLDLVMKLRMYAGIAALLLLAINVIFGTEINGAKNWIDLKFITVQPSELVKILFIFSSAATLQWLLTTKNLAILIAFSITIVGTLFYLGDFGTALIFFMTFILIAFMSTGDVKAIVSICAIAGLGTGFIVIFKSHVINRFVAWRHVWDAAYLNGLGYQMTRTLIAITDGGLLGVGIGNGFLRNVFASDTDLIFGLLCEELGIIIGLCIAACYILLLWGAIRASKNARSSYYSIAACATAGLLIFQAALNIFGSTDVLPLTGVTLPFVSNGGSSMMSCWGILAFITAVLNNRSIKDFKNKESRLAAAK